VNPAARIFVVTVAVLAAVMAKGNSMTSAITAAGLRKSFGGKTVLDGIDLEAGAGTVFSLLGPNGAGKTTVVQIMSTLVHADGGEVRVAGHDVARDPAAVRGAIGVTGQFSAVDNLLTGEENLLLMADLHHLGRAEGRRRATGLLDKFELAGSAGKTAAVYSGGMRRRLDLAMTLIGDPRIIFLDEPTTGLDPRSRRMTWQIIRELVAGGVTIFLTTQQLDEADELADRIAVLDHGKVVATGSPGELKRSIPGAHVRLHFTGATGLGAAARALGNAFRHEDTLTLEVPSDGGAIAVRELLNRLGDTAAEVDGVSVHTPDLDDVFFALTGRPAAETENVR
jgi:ABC-2 type transport system ATP-binding protein